MKKVITYLENEKDLEHILALKKQGLEIELILSCTDISRFNKISFEELLELLKKIKETDLEFALEWDVLNQEEKFKDSLRIIDQLLFHDFKTIRVQDPGAIEYIKNKYPGIKIELILENGNHNLPAIQGWVEYLGRQCSKVILSNELSKELLNHYSANLEVSIEVQVLGRILLFYTPRRLLSPLEKNKLLGDAIEAFGTSEESPHSGFPLLENRHGTFMFNVKDLSLLENLEELNQIGIEHFRVDLRFDYSWTKWWKIIHAYFLRGENSSLNQSNISHPRPFIKGFFNINKTDVLFTKLKNKRIQRNDINYLGEIVDVEKDKQLALMIKSKGKKNISSLHFKITTPDGKIKSMDPKWVKNSKGNLVQEVGENDLVLIPYVSGITVKSQVYLDCNI